MIICPTQVVIVIVIVIVVIVVVVVVVVVVIVIIVVLVVVVVVVVDACLLNTFNSANRRNVILAAYKLLVFTPHKLYH